MQAELLGAITFVVLFMLRLVVPIGFTLLVGTLVARHQAARRL